MLMISTMSFLFTLGLMLCLMDFLFSTGVSVLENKLKK